MPAGHKRQARGWVGLFGHSALILAQHMSVHACGVAPSEQTAVPAAVMICGLLKNVLHTHYILSSCGGHASLTEEDRRSQPNSGMLFTQAAPSTPGEAPVTAPTASDLVVHDGACRHQPPCLSCQALPDCLRQQQLLAVCLSCTGQCRRGHGTAHPAHPPEWLCTWMLWPAPPHSKQ